MATALYEPLHGGTRNCYEPSGRCYYIALKYGKLHISDLGSYRACCTKRSIFGTHWCNSFAQSALDRTCVPVPDGSAYEACAVTIMYYGYMYVLCYAPGTCFSQFSGTA